MNAKANNNMSIYVVKFEVGNQLGFAEISADVKGIIVYKINKVQTK